nr:hypothetical protein BaRGS_018489 [Batillaria attramentaria]
MPRTEDAALSEASSKFQGRRYVKDNDHAVILLYDVNGYIAGIQCGISKSGLPSGFPGSKFQSSALQDDGVFLTLTAYFSDPSIICTSGRSDADYQRQGTGRNLYIQTGSDPVANSVRIPHREEELQGTPWTLGRCFLAMGNHYWYNATADMNCEDFFPVFLLFNGGRLNAFGWALGLPQTSSRFEHPTGSALSYFFKEVPQCLYDIPELSTMHVYLTSWPIFNDNHQKVSSGSSFLTFGVNPFDSNVFASLPRTESDASSDGWTKIGDCDTSSKFRGRRYVKDNDYAVILLFDVNGYIAGIQCGAAKSELPSDYPPATLRSIFQDDGDHMTLTAYFTDPSQSQK